MDLSYFYSLNHKLSKLHFLFVESRSKVMLAIGRCWYEATFGPGVINFKDTHGEIAMNTCGYSLIA